LAEILLIDDEPSARQFFRRTLEGAGYGVNEVSSARDGLAHLQLYAVDLVITDILMPDMDGLELTWMLHSQFPDLKVVAVSSGGKDLDYCSVARFFGAHETLIKPVAVPRLLETVGRLTGSIF
jgi:DNA-binding NtrC family response regulator